VHAAYEALSQINRLYTALDRLGARPALLTRPHETRQRYREGRDR
jgi:hypothetical protein